MVKQLKNEEFCTSTKSATYSDPIFIQISAEKQIVSINLTITS